MANVASTVRSRIIDFKWVLGLMVVLVTGAILYVAPRNTSSADKDSNSMLVSTSWLAEHLKDPGLVIITVGPRPAYDAGHIPGARFVEMSAIATSAPGATLEIPPVEKLKSAFEDLGISNGSRIVICFLANYVSPSTRVYFTLDYLGLGAQTSLLDGGYEAWRAEGKAVTAEAPQITRGSITAKPRPELIVDAMWVSQNTNKPKVAIVDARTPEFYSGASAGRMPRAGHIPGSVNIPFNTLADASNKLKDSQTLQKLLSEAGVKQGDQIVSYCHIGQQATVVYFVAKYLGYDARLYDGSFEDWSKRSELPVVGPK
ncbi:MAG TPA: sulfurtransferase [Blastocatellia bacterium]|nr:sulfurtransferase [Blastocatellia bacterium]